jgi:hypothetical protein
MEFPACAYIIVYGNETGAIANLINGNQEGINSIGTTNHCGVQRTYSALQEERPKPVFLS